MINLFDHNNQAAADLLASLRQINQATPTIFIEDDGWLPEHTESPWSYFCEQGNSGQPLYFDRLALPDLWEIRGTNHAAEIYDDDRLAGQIIYAWPAEKRLIKEVKWFDRQQRLRSVDHYNRYGRRFAETIYNLAEQPVIKTYYTQDQHEKIVENLVTNDILLNGQFGEIFNFSNKTAFVKFYLQQREFDLSQVRYNSLSFPFFVSLNLPDNGNDILFWQEPLNQAIPANMSQILQNKAVRTKQIIFFEKSAYEFVKAHLPAETNVDLQLLGYLYPHHRLNHGGQQILIMTNSDQLEQIEPLIKELPEFEFKIAAVTEMSAKLQELQRYENVRLFPNVSPIVTEQLWQTADFYLDINHQAEIKNAVRTAFDNNLLILGFENILHAPRYVAQAHIFKSAEFQQLAALLKKCRLEQNFLQTQLKLQHLTANEVSTASYRKLLTGEHHAKR
ncbi:accessory Sec system glycosylation chaperone GtfB [Liquorilactobacillus sicerae]|uniref:accessory Sec system glycosylation chaperone GtfB n=1 Tax=Liquorilactobacillus sicerae TaxID=1416943 RepID=UPI0024801F6C|nr:accessory Sec system glycosylation chaperone GtfB [Liquorilactobacillus sicerae]